MGSDELKEKSLDCEAALKEIMEAFPKKRLGEFLGHFNELFLFISAAVPGPKEKKKLSNPRG